MSTFATRIDRLTTQLLIHFNENYEQLAIFQQNIVPVNTLNDSRSYLVRCFSIPHHPDIVICKRIIKHICGSILQNTTAR